LPDDIEIILYLGSGYRAYVYKAKLDEIDVVVKVYKPGTTKKYSAKYRHDIAKFEFNRNSALYNIDDIKAHIAKPYRFYPENSEFTHSVVQEYIIGETLEVLIGRLDYLPKELLEIGHRIVNCAEKAGLHDLDISVGNVMAKEVDGKWKLFLYDFNIMPQYMFPPNPIMGLAFKLGLRKKSFRDYRSLRNWERRGKQKWWIGRN